MTTDDRQATGDRPTSHFWKISMAISQQRVVQFTSCLVLGGVFGVDRSNSAISDSLKFKIANHTV